MKRPSGWQQRMIRVLWFGIGLLFGIFSAITVAANTEYYVSKDGSDSNPCSETLPCLKINTGIGKLSAGDTLIVKSGVYKETLDCANFPVKNSCIPEGTSWTNPTAIRAFPGDVVRIRPKGKQNALRVVHLAGSNSRYIVIDGLVIDARNVQQEGIKITSGANHVRIGNCTIMNAPAMGILITGEASQHNEVINCGIHDIGTNSRLDHGLYVSTANNLIQGNEIHSIASHGIHLYGSPGMSGNVFRDNVISGCRYGIGIYGGDNNLLFNNVISNQSEVGIRLRNDYEDLGGALVFNNTLYGRGAGDTGIENDSTASPTTIRNNIVFNFERGLNDVTASAVLETNLIDVDPYFVDASSADFHLRAASPAVDSGMALGEVPRDRDGVGRPRGQAYDVGAVEFEPSPPASGRTFFVSVAGNDGNPGTEVVPFRTINRGIKSLSSGDTLIIRAGTYEESIVYTIPPSGIGWSKMTTIKAYPGEAVIIKPSVGPMTYRVIDFTQVEKATQFILWENLILDGANVQYEVVKIGDSYSRMRFVNCEFRNSPSMGILIPGEHSRFNEFIRCYVHDVGTSTQFQHGFYFEASDQLVDGCLIERASGHGIHLYGNSGMDRLVVRDTTIRNCERGIGLYGGSGHLIYNNVIHNIAGYAMLMRNDQGDLGDVRIFNNTFYKSGSQLYNFTTNSKLPGTKIINNIAYLVKFGIQDDTGRAVVSHNLTDDPLFVDSANGNFHLLPGSPAIDAGVMLNEVLTDRERLQRSQGRAPDIGAYETPSTAGSAGMDGSGSGLASAGVSLITAAIALAALLLYLAICWTSVVRKNANQTDRSRRSIRREHVTDY